MAITRRPATILAALCVIALSVSAVGAAVCHNKQEECMDKFSWPLVSLCCTGCLVVLFSVFFVEFGGGRGGVGG